MLNSKESKGWLWRMRKLLDYEHIYMLAVKIRLEWLRGLLPLTAKLWPHLSRRRDNSNVNVRICGATVAVVTDTVTVVGTSGQVVPRWSTRSKYPTYREQSSPSEKIETGAFAPVKCEMK